MTTVITGKQATLEEPLAFDPFELQDTVTGDVRDPFPFLEELRRNSPVHVGPLHFPGMPSTSGLQAPDRPQPVSVLGYDEVVSVLRDNERFSSSVYADVMGIVMGKTILQMDEPDHRKHRALVSPAFRSRILQRWEHELVRAVVDDLIDRFCSKGHADLVRDVTFAFPVQVIARILGLPMREYPRFQRWTMELISVAANWERGMAASQALGEYFAGILAARRVEPADDLISELAATEVDGQHLSDEEIFAFLRLLLPAGVETTYRATGNLLYGLLTHPDQLEALKQDRSLMSQAFEESLRWEPPVTMILRRAMSDTEIYGVPVASGTDIGVFLASANRDERRFSNPNEFDIFRDPLQHVGFGFGVHMCLGMHLARMESRVAINAILDRLDGLCLDPSPGEDPHIHGLAFRSPTSLPVSFRPC